MRNLKVVAAVTGALAAAWAVSASAALPTQAQSNLDPNTASNWALNISGSSAVRDALKNFVGAQFCGGAANLVTYQAAGNNNPDFRAYSCFSAGGAGNPVPAGTVLTIYDRSEFGSVAGVGPIVFPTRQIARLSLAAGCTYSGTPAVPAAAQAPTSNHLNDQWPTTGGTASPCIAGGPAFNNRPDSFGQLGISDLEPAVFINDNWGTDYPTFNPPATLAQLQAVNATPIIGQSFGLIVNTSGLAGFSGTAADLTTNAIANILTGQTSDWHNVITTNGNRAAAAAGSNIKVCNREPGSGTRTGASIFFLGESGCGSSGGLVFDGAKNCSPNNPGNNCFATGDVLACVNATPGAIGYVSIDNFAKVAAPVLPVSIDDAAKTIPTNLRTAAGQYTWFFEASANLRNGLGGNQLALANAIINKLQDVTTTAQSAQVTAIPNAVAANTPTFAPLTQVGVVPVNNFTRNGNSCSNYPGAVAVGPTN